MKKFLVKQNATSASVISSSDGPTSIILLKNEHKSNIKQSMQRKLFEIRKKWHALWIKPNPHTMEEVAEYIRQKYDFMELPKDDEKIPEELFSLEHYYFEKQEAGVQMHIQLESHYGYIGGGASGKFISKYHKIYKDVYRYYGVSEEDISNNSKRYQDLLRTLAMRH